MVPLPAASLMRMRQYRIQEGVHSFLASLVTCTAVYKVQTVVVQCGSLQYPMTVSIVINSTRVMASACHLIGQYPIVGTMIFEASLSALLGVYVCSSPGRFTNGVTLFAGIQSSNNILMLEPRGTVTN